MPTPNWKKATPRMAHMAKEAIRKVTSTGSVSWPSNRK
jgi:hypothetical protein